MWGYIYETGVAVGEAAYDYMWGEEEEPIVEPEPESEEEADYLSGMWPDVPAWLGGGEPEEDVTGQPADDPVPECPYADPESDRLKSIWIDFSWAFSGDTPTADYVLTINGQSFPGALDNGQIFIDQKLHSTCGDGTVQLTLASGLVVFADIHLDLPPVQDPKGYKRRLTNLGYYAGTDASFDRRAAWATRAFKRKNINEYRRNSTVVENDEIDEAFLNALSEKYSGSSPDPGDNAAAGACPLLVDVECEDCNMFGPFDLTRGTYEHANRADDKDPEGAGNSGNWGTTGVNGKAIQFSGTYDLYLRAFDPHLGEPDILNRVALPQPVHMTQFVLFELGYWAVGGAFEATGIGDAETKNRFIPDGGFGRNTQWAVREFQCYSKGDYCAREDTWNVDARYLPRLFRDSPGSAVGLADYPNDGPISGTVNARTRSALQGWADGKLRCPIIVYSADTHGDGTDLDTLQKENIWRHDDDTGAVSNLWTTRAAPRMFAIDYSDLYDRPGDHGGYGSWNGFSFPKPIGIGVYVSSYDGGQITVPHQGICWDSEYAEVKPGTLVTPGAPDDGSTLTDHERSWFRVIRTAAHFECSGYFDSLNSYDNVTISFGPCHWTLAWCAGRTNGRNDPDLPREMPAFFSYFRDQDAAGYWRYFGKFGLYPAENWPLGLGGEQTYNTRMNIQTEQGATILCGQHGTREQRWENNKYCKTWHSYYRFQMACRTSTEMRRAMWDFSRFRVRDIMAITHNVDGRERPIGEYATSEKSAAMILRWHIRSPSNVTGNRMRDIMRNVHEDHPDAGQAREDAMIARLTYVADRHHADDGERRIEAGTPELGDEDEDDTGDHLEAIESWTDIPQTGMARYYELDMGENSVLSSDVDSLLPSGAP